MIDSLTYVTSNPGKAELLSHSLRFPVLHTTMDLIEIQSLDIATIIEYKAKEAFQQVLSPVLVEDSSLQFAAWRKLPGPFIKWFLAELGPDGLCRLLDGTPERSALASIHFGLYDGQAFHAFAGAREGSIALTPRGSHGFGWDSIFIPSGSHKTWAEMTEEEGQATSIRTIALNKLEAYLSSAV
jgi:non-canonical purine NTP pyrophosphatase (RdgB/HAM1 family)